MFAKYKNSVLAVKYSDFSYWEDVSVTCYILFSINSFSDLTYKRLITFVPAAFEFIVGD